MISGEKVQAIQAERFRRLNRADDKKTGGLDPQTAGKIKSTNAIPRYSMGPNLDWKRTMLALLFEIFLIFSHSLSVLIHQKY